MAREGDTEQDSSIIQTRTRILFGDQVEAGEICAEVTTVRGNYFQGRQPKTFCR